MIGHDRIDRGGFLVEGLSIAAPMLPLSGIVCGFAVYHFSIDAGVLPTVHLGTVRAVVLKVRSPVLTG